MLGQSVAAVGMIGTMRQGHTFSAHGEKYLFFLMGGLDIAVLVYKAWIWLFQNENKVLVVRNVLAPVAWSED